MDLKMKDLEQTFNEAMESSARYIGVKISMNGFPSDEVIINQTENFEKKLEYYKDTYDEGLNHKHAPGICIVGFNYADDFATLEETLITK